jgi:hypothetical protein
MFLRALAPSCAVRSVARPLIKTLHILIESTPNPCSKKFSPGCVVRAGNEDIKTSLLYRRLRDSASVISGVFYGPDFITGGGEYLESYSETVF